MKGAEFCEIFMNIGEPETKLEPDERLRMILDAPPLEIAWILAPLKLQIHSEVYKMKDKVSVVDVIDTEIDRFKVYHPCVESILSGADQRYNLWRVEIFRSHVRLHYYLAGVDRPHGSIIDIKTNNKHYLSLLVKAQPFNGLAERQFCCNYCDDVAFGRIIRVATYTSQRGIKISEDYSEADLRQFDQIIHY